ncbi:TIGR02281 family clan AA aspartic protease [Sphingomonas gei]|uniref:TIGR02281 family clan AA aspartic protease n=1 Tax=Sphingomonas gei TaxID=1395960 RepID=A0A4S1XC67_9SPHN|nr:TIGR02281 family clan AA aspartic protease [Sphingomonas gei]TGX53518.1 TIGR02281 family clan AA aspartic protease [Sphingomonas gei]
MVDERFLWLAAMIATGTALVAASAQPPVRATPVAPIASVAIAAPVPDARPSHESKRIVLDRAPDGLFYIHGQVNGTRVRFLIDTGATALILSAEDAARAKLRADGDSIAGALQTASGPATMSWVSADTLEVGGRAFEAMPAAVPSGGLKVSLLGQSVLSKLGPITLDGDQMVIGSDRL